LARTRVGSFLGLLEAIGFALDGEDLGVVDQAMTRETTQAAFGKTSRHSAKGRLVVTIVLLCS
jgi:hypothetical protein